MRVFVGIPLPEGIKKEISQIVNQLKDSKLPIKWEPEEKWHITLKFFGEVDENHELRIMNYGKKAVEKIPSFFLRLEKTEFFYKRHLIVWVSVEGQMDVLRKLYQLLEENLVKIGFPKEKREFKGHITIGRGKKISGQQLKELKEVLFKIKSPKFSEFKVNRINLYQSILKPECSKYLILEEFILGKS